MIVSALDVTSCNPVCAPGLTPRGHNLRVFLSNPSKNWRERSIQGPAQIIGQEAILGLHIEPLKLNAPCLVLTSIAAKRFARELNLECFKGQPVSGYYPVHTLSVFSLNSERTLSRLKMILHLEFGSQLELGR